MTPQEARDFLADHKRAILATVKSDGSPQMSPVVAAVGGDGRVMISSRETAYKVRNLRRDARAWLCVISDAFFGQWIQIEGTVEVVSLPVAMEPLVEYYRRLSGEHPDWDEYRAAMARERRVMVYLTIDRVGPDRSG